jgi:YidC/Oxa1 family membrane protein insertase
MDRKSIVILVVSFALLILWFPLVQKIYPPKVVPRTNVQASATGVATQATAPPTSVVTTATAPAPIPALAVPPGSPETTLVITNDEIRYTFTSHGGGIKLIELVGYPARTCVPKGSPERTNWAALNIGATLPVLAVSGPSLSEDGLFSLSTTGAAIRAEKRLTNGLVWVKQFELSSNNLLKATIRLENTSSEPMLIAPQQWAAGAATPLTDTEAQNVRGLYWYNGEKAAHVDPGWFANRSAWSCVGMPSTPRHLYEAGASNVVWTAVHNQFFALAVMPKEPAIQVLAQPVTNTMVAWSTGQTNNTKVVGAQAALLYPEVTIAPNQSLERSFYIFAGPREYKTIQRIGLAFNNNLDLIMGFGWFGFFAKLLLLSMNGLHALALNYAMAIIAITIIIKLLFWPLTQASTRSMKRMQALQPQMRVIQEKFKDDPVKMNRKMMEFMKEHKVNPVGGCLPMFLQIPVFIGFYQMIQSAIELRGERFLWACDLSRPDTIFVLPGLNFPVNPLPLIMGATMLWQARLTPPSPGMDPVQQKIMRYMPLMFLFILYNFSAGLTLYWTVQNLLTIAQMKLTKAKEEDKPNAPGKPIAAAPPKKKK